jgi:hypothetical protein
MITPPSTSGIQNGTPEYGDVGDIFMRYLTLKIDQYDSTPPVFA